MHAPEESLEQHSFRQLRPLKVSSELLATLACTLVVSLARFNDGVSPWLYSYCAAAALMCYLTFRARTTQQLWFTGLLLLCICTACLGALSSALGNPMFWFLPIGLVLSLPASSMHVRPWHALSTGVGIWVTLFYVVEPVFARPLDLTFTLILIAGSLGVATMVCLTFCRTREDIFDLQRQLHSMAYRDTLTGLPNRRAFMERLAATLAEGPDRLYFLMLDIDDFKRINDRFGHHVGDRVLVDIAAVLREHAAQHNLARLGGEEFAVAAALGDAPAAQALAQSIVEAVHGCAVEGQALSISVGLATHCAGVPIASLMRRADHALYQAKHEGKNRYAVAEPA